MLYNKKYIKFKDECIKNRVTPCSESWFEYLCSKMSGEIVSNSVYDFRKVMS